jgi:hypothetical protein
MSERRQDETDEVTSMNTGDDLDARSIRELLQKSSRLEEAPPDLVAGFQRKLRKRSRGKFYADGWSTAKQPPIMTYLITSLLMLAMVFAAYAVLRPLSGEAVKVPMTPAPVQVIPPGRTRAVPTRPSAPAPP